LGTGDAFQVIGNHREAAWTRQIIIIDNVNDKSYISDHCHNDGLARKTVTLALDTQILVQVRIELPATLSDKEARRVAEAEAIRRLTALPWVVEAVPAALGKDD
jgi:hypothetical protein